MNFKDVKTTGAECMCLNVEAVKFITYFYTPVYMYLVLVCSVRYLVKMAARFPVHYIFYFFLFFSVFFFFFELGSLMVLV